jgi:hypothetical protein
LTIALVLVCALAIFVVCWLQHAKRLDRDFRARVELMISEYHEEHPKIPRGRNAAPLYRKAFALFVEPKEGSTVFNKDAKPEAIDEYLLRNREYIQAILKAVERPEYSLNVDISRGYDVQFDALGKFRRATRILALEARRDIANGQADRAARLVSVILRLGRDASRPGTLSPHLAGQGVNLVAAGVLRTAMQDGKLSVASVESLLGELAAHDRKSPKLAAALRAEKTWSLVVIRNALEDGGALDMGVLRISTLGVKDADLYAETLDEAIALADKPFWQVREAAHALSDKTEGLPGWRCFSNMMMPALGGVMAGENRTRTYLAGARLALGCRLYLLRFGEFPDGLADLSRKLPEHFKTLPADPFTGKPFSYKRTTQGCRLWAPGKDKQFISGRLKDIVFELKR